MIDSPAPINYGTTRSREESFDDEAFLDSLPRAVLRPNEHVLLDGEWKFDIDPNDSGIQDMWCISHDFTKTAHWPGSVEEHIAQAQKNTDSWRDKIVVWYEREFELPEKETEKKPDSLLQLTFGACGYETRVWLNGHPLLTIEGEETHIGEYTSFSYELEDKILKPTNRLTVRVASSMDADTTRGKQESHVYKRGGIWYQTYTGAVRSVWLETVGGNRLRSRVGVLTMVEDNLVRFNLTTRVHDPGSYLIRLKVFNITKETEDPIAVDEYSLVLEAGQKSQRLVIAIPNPKLWSPESPHQYRLVAQLIDKNNYISEIETKFGMRKFEARGSQIYLNNQPVYLDGILYQPGASTYDQIQAHMYAMKDLVY